MDSNSKPFSEHLEELRSFFLRLIAIWGGATLLALFFVSPLSSFLLSPYGTEKIPTFLLLSPLEGWWTATFVALLSGALFACPLLLYLIFSYLLPALYPEEGKKIVFLGGSLLVFSALGLWLGHFYFTPFVIHSLEAMTLVPGVPAYALREALHFVVSVDLGAMLLFNLMGGFFIAVLKGWIEVGTLVAWRRPFILGAFIVGAILTPPDVFSQVLMAACLIGSFEAVILVQRVISFLRGPSLDHRFHRDSDAICPPQEQKSLEEPGNPL